MSRIFEIRTRRVVFGNILFPDLIIHNPVTFIKGTSGCGKSTLLRLFNRTITQSEGSIEFNGKSINDMDPVMLRRDLLYVGQNVFLFSKSIRDNFKEYYEYLDRNPPSDEHIKKYLKICCLDLDLDVDCDRLSGGERHRVFNSIYVSLEPKVLMMDEPTAALDIDTAKKFIRNIIQYTKEQEIMLIIVGHNLEHINEFKENTMDLSKGDV